MTDQTIETARALLYRHGLPEDVIDGALCLHARELAAVQRAAIAKTDDPVFYEGEAGWLVNVIEPDTTPATPLPMPADEARTRLLQALDASFCQALGFTPEGLLAAYEASRTQTVDQDALRDRIAAAIWARTPEAEPSPTGLVMGNPHGIADAVLAVLPAPVDRAAVLRDGADELDARMARFFIEWPDEPRNSPYALGQKDAANELRRVADETAATETEAAVDLPALAAALDGFGTLLATSSRDWGVYRVDAWLYAVILGWDCEETEHDATCTHGALEEMAQQHGWDDATVAKARRYRAAVRTLIETHRPAAGARQDGEQA